MNKALILAGGGLNALFAVLHVWLGWQIHLISNLPPGYKALLEMLNVGGTIFIAFFAYASFFCLRDLLDTALGKAVLFVVFLLYTTRAIEEVIIAPRFSPLIFVLCLIVGAIYLVALLRSGRVSSAIQDGRS